MRIDLIIRQNPFCRLTTFFVAGILFARFWSNYERLCIACLILILLILLSGGISRNKNEISKHLRGIAVFIMLFLAGASLYTSQVKHTQLPEDLCYYQGIIIEPLTNKGKTYQTDCLLEAMHTGDTLTHLYEKVRLYLRIDSLTKPPETGDSIYFNSVLQKIRNRGNPGEFDYAKYMADEGIFYSTFLNTGEYWVGGNSGRKALYRLATRVQSKIIKLFMTNAIKGEELGVISALVAGDRQYLDQNVRDNYISAGAMHILAVSGLHVGILYLFLNLLFGSRCQLLYFRVLKLLVILICIWFYAFVTGLSTSVLRAAIMFSLFLIGQSFYRNSNSYNLLAASAFIILLIDPTEIFKVGFQYSYLAVFGILYFQPRLENLLIFKQTIPDRIWQLVTVSLAAQLSTFPLALYYFHQFPSYFLLTNLVVIPIVWLIMMTTILFCVVSPMKILAWPIAKLLEGFLRLNNYTIKGISNLPFAKLTNIYFEWYHLLISFLVLILLMYLIHIKKKMKIPILLGISTILLICIEMSFYCFQSKRNVLILYNIKDQHCMSYIEGHKHIVFTNRIGQGTTGNALQYQTPYWVKERIEKKINRIRLEEHQNQTMKATQFSLSTWEQNYRYRIKNNIYMYKDRSDSQLCTHLINGNENINWLIDRESGFPGKYQEGEKIPEQIILLNYTPLYLKRAWIEYADINSIKVHDMEHEGALIVNF